MRVIRNEEPGGKRVLVLGTFDGVHKGHQRLLEIGKKYAVEHGILLRACSFDRHPLEVLCPSKAPKLLTTLAEKTALMYRCGADELQLMPFTQKTADLAPDEFLKRLKKTVKVQAITAGWNYTFGRGGQGNAEMLLEDGKRNGYDVMIVPPVKTEDGEIISSTLIRKQLQEGRMAEAEKMLGYPYILSGRVKEGKHEGHRIGVPTANVQTARNKLLPAFGVYPCIVFAGERKWHGAVNIGLQPTLPSGKVTVEAHILDGNPELYGKKVRLVLGNRIRAERKFNSAEELAAQIRKDTEIIRNWFNMA